MAAYSVLDLYCLPGGVSRALDAHDISHLGVDIADNHHEYQGDFVRASAAADAIPLDDSMTFDLVWASPPCTAYSSLSPIQYGSVEAAMEANPTIEDLGVREVCERLGREHVIENVPRATMYGALNDPTRLNGFAFDRPFDYERHFETSFDVPDALGSGEPEVAIRTREDDSQSMMPLAEAKGVPSTWGKQGIRSAMPPFYVEYLLSFCPTLSVPRPERAQQTLDAFEGGL